MFKDNKYIKTLVWHGKIKEVECKKHSMAYSGKMPCTGMLKCIYCGYHKNTFNGE